MTTVFIVCDGHVIALAEGKTRDRGVFSEFVITDIIATHQYAVSIPPAVSMCHVLFIDTLYHGLDEIASHMNRREFVVPF